MATVALSMIRFMRIDGAFQHFKQDLIQLILRTTPPGPGNPVAMYLNDKTNATARYMVYGIHQSQEVFGVVEVVNRAYELERVLESVVYPSMESLLSEFKGLVEVPLPAGEQGSSGKQA